MATCNKCGKPKLSKRQDGLFACKHCGVMPGPKRLGRTGTPTKTAEVIQ